MPCGAGRVMPSKSQNPKGFPSPAWVSHPRRGSSSEGWGAAGPGGIRAGNGVSAVAKWNLAKGLGECDRARGHLMAEDTARAVTAPHSPCSWGTELFPVCRARWGPARGLGWDFPALSFPPKPEIINPLPSDPPQAQRTAQSSSEHPKGTGQGGAASRDRQHLAQHLHHKQALSEQPAKLLHGQLGAARGKKQHKPSQFRIQGHCRATGEGNLAASSCRAVMDFSRAQDTPVWV